jgi:oligoendopeptidase F
MASIVRAMPIPETPIKEWNELELRYQELTSSSLNDQNAYRYLLDWSDLLKEIEEGETYLNLQSDLNTANEAATAELSHFNQVTKPKVTLANAALRRRFLALAAPQLPDAAFLIRRRMQSDEAAYCETNVSLEADHADLVNEFSRLTGNNLAEYNGQKLTIPQIEEKLRAPDRTVRQGAWRAWQAAKQKIAPALDELFLRMFRLRRQMAANLGVDNYRTLIWHRYHRYDYTPADCADLHASIAEEVVPWASELLETHRRRLGLSSLKPWDFYWKAPVDPEGRNPLHPFDTVEQLESTTEAIFSTIDPELGRQFAGFRNGFMDLGSRPNKMPHAYCASFPKKGMPFVLQNVVGSENDVRVTLHEFGHAFHGYASMQAQPLFWNYFSATEFVEVPSQAMEVLALPYLHKARGGFYDDEALKRVYQAQIAAVVHLLTWIGFMDSIQHWIYAEAPVELTIGQIDRKAEQLIARFMPQTDWTGLEPQLAKVWHYHHIFSTPFYYIEYGLSWLGALQIWRNSLQDPVEALSRYRAALNLGNSKSVPELFAAAGARFAFDRGTVRELMRFLREQLHEP